MVVAILVEIILLNGFRTSMGVEWKYLQMLVLDSVRNNLIDKIGLCRAEHHFCEERVTE